MKKIMQLNFAVILMLILITCMIFVTKYKNISQANIQQTNKQSAIIYINAYLITTLIILSIQLILTLIGLPFIKSILPIQILLQILGLISYSWYILFSMHYVVIAYMCGVFVIIPFLLDILGRILGIIKFRKYSIVDLY